MHTRFVHFAFGQNWLMLHTIRLGYFTSSLKDLSPMKHRYILVSGVLSPGGNIKSLEIESGKQYDNLSQTTMKEIFPLIVSPSPSFTSELE